MRDGVRPSRDCPQKRARYTESHMEVRRPRVAATQPRPHTWKSTQARGRRQTAQRRPCSPAPARGPTSWRDGAVGSEGATTHQRPGHTEESRASTYTQPYAQAMVTHGANQARKGCIQPNTQTGEPDCMVKATPRAASDLRWLRDGMEGGGGNNNMDTRSGVHTARKRKLLPA